MGLNGTNVEYHKCPPALVIFPPTDSVIMFFLHFCFMAILVYQVRVSKCMWGFGVITGIPVYLELITFGNKVEPNLGTGW